jgi:hypothetical protein
MSAGAFTSGFWCQGKRGARRLVRWGPCMAAFARAEGGLPLDQECFVSAFTFDVSLRTHLDAHRGSEEGFAGPTFAPLLWFDVDAADLDDALLSARRLANYLLFQSHGLGDDDVLAFFSGMKGVHLGMPVLDGAAPPGSSFHRACAAFAARVAREVGAGIDGSVYTATRLFRAPNSRHATSGLFKVRLTHDELMNLDAAGIRKLAAAPRPFDWPQALPAWAAWNALAEVWRAAEADTAAAAAVRVERVASAAAHHVTRETLDVLSGGLAALLDVPEAARAADPVHQSRHRRLVRAAGNLAECGVPSATIHQLLTEAGLDARITPSEVRRAIDNGIALANRDGRPLP